MLSFLILNSVITYPTYDLMHNFHNSMNSVWIKLNLFYSEIQHIFA